MAALPLGGKASLQRGPLRHAVAEPRPISRNTRYLPLAPKLHHKPCTLPLPLSTWGTLASRFLPSAAHGVPARRPEPVPVPVPEPGPFTARPRQQGHSPSLAKPAPLLNLNPSQNHHFAPDTHIAHCLLASRSFALCLHRHPFFSSRRKTVVEPIPILTLTVDTGQPASASRPWLTTRRRAALPPPPPPCRLTIVRHRASPLTMKPWPSRKSALLR